MTLRRLLVAQFVLPDDTSNVADCLGLVPFKFEKLSKRPEKGFWAKNFEILNPSFSILSLPSLQCMWIALFVSVLFYHSSNFFKGKVWSRKSIALCLRLSKVLRFEIPKRNLTKIAFKWVINPTTNDAILNFVYQVAYLGRYGQSLTLFFTS